MAPKATSHWRSTAPMATYLAFLTIGRFAVVTSTTPQGLPMYTAYERGGGVLVQRARRDVSRTPGVIGFLQKRWGPYPFDVGGAIVSRLPYGGLSRPTALSEGHAWLPPSYSAIQRTYELLRQHGHS
jgi:aminopeptidase N